MNNIGEEDSCDAEDLVKSKNMKKKRKTTENGKDDMDTCVTRCQATTMGDVGGDKISTSTMNYE